MRKEEKKPSARPTIQDIARLAGVSTATVSRVMNQSSRVDPQTRQKILRIIDEQRYVPSPIARSLKGQNNVIGLLVPQLRWDAIYDALWGVTAQVTARAGYGIMLYSCPGVDEYRQQLEQILQTRSVSGLITMVYEQVPDELFELHEQGLPIVVIDPVDLPISLPRVGTDHYNGAYDATRHLLELGHRAIYFLQGPEEFQCSAERYQGYSQALRNAGLMIDPAWIYTGKFDHDSGFEIASKIFADTPHPAIFASNDSMAYGVLRYTNQHDLRPGVDFSLVGFNDDPLPEHQPAILTTIHQPFTEMGRCAVDVLLSQVSENYTLPEQWQPYVVEPARFRLPTHLIVRETTGRPVDAR